MFFIYRSSLPPSITNPDSACFIFQNGALQPIAFSLAATQTPPQQSQPQNSQQSQSSRGPTPSVSNAIETNSSSSNASTGEVLKAINKKDGAMK